MGEREGGRGGGSAPEKKNRRGRRRKKVLATGLIVLGSGEKGKEN